ncbi:MAG: tyrosine-type recombinase/integrase [Planctomycetota bacterium]
MAVRWRKYFKECKSVQCNGKRSNQCPGDRPQACGGQAIEYRELNGRWVSKIFPDISKTQAKELLEEIKSNIRRKMVGLPTMAKIQTLAEYSQKYLEHQRGDKVNTLVSKQRAIKVLVQYLGNYPLDKITSFLVERFRVERKEKDDIKDSSINIDLQVLSHIFTIAIKEGIVSGNPCRDVKRLKTAQTRDRVLSGEEIALLLNLPQSKDRTIILTALFTGMRLNEVISLEWDSIDFGKGIISIVQSKTGKLVSIPLSEYLRNVLEAYRMHSTGGKVFESREITRAIASKYSIHFSLLFKSLGIINFTFHNLRHTFASLQADLGTGAIITKEMLGHTSLDMTLRYSHGGLDSKKKAIDMLTGHILSISENTKRAIAQ